MKKKTKTIKKRFKKLRIVSSNYVITYHDEIRDEKGNYLDGRAYESTQHMLILETLNYEPMLRTIFHEVLHIINFELCFTLENEEERNIQLTTGLTCFMRDNPEFIMEYIKVLNKR